MQSPLPSQQQQARGRNPALKAKIAQMALPLSPLVSLTSGTTHPIFPSTLLNFWLLTSSQLDDLAHFYHQRTPGLYTRHYRCPIPWDTEAILEVKRRRLGRFIGLRGCESPVNVQTSEEIEREARRERERRAEEEAFREVKGRWY